MGINQLATLSTGESFDGQQTEKVHKKTKPKELVFKRRRPVQQKEN
ncbi:hypothetical protein [Arachidicoccus ginsenosidivorans]|nr:hypothetical protein [Arachidicoccus ginsenosidivorans]